MKEIIRSFGFTKETSIVEIEEKLLTINDFTSSYFLIKKMNCSSYGDAAKEIFDYLQTMENNEINK